MPELLDHVSQEMIKLYPLIVDLHTASLGNILTLAPVISDRSQGAFCARKTIGLVSQGWTRICNYDTKSFATRCPAGYELLKVLCREILLEKRPRTLIAMARKV